MTQRAGVQEDTAGLAYLGTDAAAGREVGIDLLRLLEPTARIPVLLGAHRALDEVGVGEDLVPEGDVELDAIAAAHSVAVGRGGARCVAGCEDAGVDLEAREVGQVVPSQDDPALGGARPGARPSVRRVRFAVHRL